MVLAMAKDSPMWLKENVGNAWNLATFSEFLSHFYENLKSVAK
jgi:hypothetical protein